MRCVGACNVLPLSTMVEAVPYSHTLCFWVSSLPFHGDIRAINQNIFHGDIRAINQNIFHGDIRAINQNLCIGHTSCFCFLFQVVIVQLFSVLLSYHMLRKIEKKKAWVCVCVWVCAKSVNKQKWNQRSLKTGVSSFIYWKSLMNVVWMHIASHIRYLFEFIWACVCAHIIFFMCGMDSHCQTVFRIFVICVHFNVRQRDVHPNTNSEKSNSHTDTKHIHC